ncbi:biotin/lipoyl-binding protein [Nostocoides sp. F2B08]|uniref:acetyl/propionyl/methylcrotonyl-CoA carboxylase subunit alpha n=1 Tax=Nostocoides sp. F2B08 TaxID=2653936 RepID=UPI001263A029|nr:biotin carboxylase N-terminal domain-containing protein [Tetrasphaera sp. F2B08]KAB7745407.1 biotin/lipoyl-binding protein [Tetrasphaera sp. F2B08]
MPELISTDTTTITSVLVANRGEIARRVFATCRRRGLATVAVHSDADVTALHVREADAAVRLPGNAAAETYLHVDRIIEAARRAGADAVHPGYGFLSENADFAQAVQDAGLTWIGPPAEAIRLMGSKVAAKELMRAAGVPVLDRLDQDAVTEADLPLLVKASAGGGGRGMRIVRRLDDLPAAIESADAEAASAFGDGTVFCERFVEGGHHVEVQVMADRYGTVWALGERECSLQRRHQKVIEEAPSPLVERVGPGMRDRLLEAGRAAAAAVGYVGAGTVEFLATEDGSFFFLEMNTRLQVEHPVTECVTGLDLVGLQLDVAQGRALEGAEPTMTGWSVEARIYAEDPADGWTPQTGTVAVFDVPGVGAEFDRPPEHGIRLDSGVSAGSVVSTHYDAMLAKVISRAPTREAAVRELTTALRRTRMHGVRTNRDLLVATLAHPEVLAGTAHTGFYDTNDPAALSADTGLAPDLGALVAALADAAEERSRLGHLVAVSSGFRTVRDGLYRHRAYLVDGGGADGDGVNGSEYAVGYRFARDGLELERLPAGTQEVRLVDLAGDRVVLELDGVRRSFEVSRHPVPGQDEAAVAIDSPLGSVELRRLPRFVDPSARAPEGALVAPMPGAAVRIAVSVGDVVAAGQPLMWLEAMKMEHVIAAPAAGTVREILVSVGQQVEQGTTLAVVDPAAAEDGPAA